MIASSLLLAALLTPTGLVPITDFGAKPDGSKCTAAFARAIRVCADAGGGRDGAEALMDQMEEAAEEEL